MRKRFIFFGVAFLSLLLAAPAAAECRCECVDGKAQPVCENSFDYKPPCSSYCPYAPYSFKPFREFVNPPPGMKCDKRQVLNSQTRQYEWRTICE